MIFLAAALAALIAGVGWLIRDLPGVTAAPRTGVIRSKAYGSPLIRREDDPERFERLVAYRKKGLLWGWLLAGGGALFLLAQLAPLLIGMGRAAAAAG